MSKADQWHEFAKAHPRPRYSSGFLSAEVNDHGDLHIESEAEAHRPDRALAFAWWIIDTFGVDDHHPALKGHAVSPDPPPGQGP